MTDLTPNDLRQQPGVCRPGRSHGDDCGACDLSPDASPCTGQQPAQQPGVCSECKGSGRTGSGYLREDCPACKGTGRQPAQPASLLRPAVVASAADCQKPQLVVTRGDGVPLPDQAAALAEFKRQCLQPAQPGSRDVERWCNDLFNTGRAVEHYEHPSMRPLSEEEYILYRAARARESAARDCIQTALAAAKAYADDMEARYHTARERLTAAQQREAELRDALREYGGHLDDCAGMAGALDPRCTCGFRAALTAAQQRIAELESENAGLRTQREGGR